MSIALACILPPTAAVALDPSLSLPQLKHTTWGPDRGAPTGIVAITQSPDGFLWLGSNSGLYRFDGVSFDQIPPISGDLTRSNQIVAVLAARDGSIWAGHFWGGLSVYRNGVMRDANHGPPTGTVVRILQAVDGAIWVGTNGIKGAQISRYKNGRWSDAGVSLGLGAGLLLDMLLSHDGTLWVLSDQFTAALPPDAQRYISMPASNAAAQLAEGPDRRMWSVGLSGVRSVLLPGSAQSEIAVASAETYYDKCALFDRDGNLLTCPPDGGLEILRSSDLEGATRRTKTPAKQDHGSHSSNSSTTFEDREGNIWVGGAGGLEQIRSTNIVWEPFETVWTSDARRMVTVPDGKLYFADGNDLKAIDPTGFFSSVGKLDTASNWIVMLCPDRDSSLWVLNWDKLYHWKSGRFLRQDLPRAWTGQLLTSCAVDGAGDLWVSVVRVGLFRRHAGTWTLVETPSGQKPSWPYLSTDSQGRIVAITNLAYIGRSNGRLVETLGSAADAGVGFVRILNARPDDMLIGGERGLSRYDGRHFQPISSSRHPWLANMSSILQTPDGDSWLTGGQGIVRLRTADLERAFLHPEQPIPHQLFDLNDGFQGSVLSIQNFQGAIGPDGKLWFQSDNGLMWIDPKHLRHNPTPPPVIIKAITANAHTYPTGKGLVLPQGVRSLQIDYTAICLTMSERVQFRYRLQGVDKDWVDPGTRRQAFYTNLTPATYRFDVIAANNDGVWNTTGATLDFRIEPTFWQTRLFAAILILAAISMMWLLYTLRLRQVEQRIRLRFEDRLGERVRIARELHDTLLQGFQGLILRFSSAAQQIPDTSPTRVALDQALDSAEQVLIEGRDRVRNLRAGDSQGDLSHAIEEAAYRLRPDPAATISMVVNGEPRPIHPIIADEILAIAEQALFNAFTHARASQFDIHLTYVRNELRLRIADNGVGIDSAMLEAGGRPGHFGLPGMRERARKLKARLTIRNVGATGTEVLLTVAGRVAFVRAPHRWSLFHESREMED